MRSPKSDSGVEKSPQCCIFPVSEVSTVVQRFYAEQNIPKEKQREFKFILLHIYYIQKMVVSEKERQE